MIIKDTKSSHLDEYGKNNSDTNSNEDNKMLQNIKMTVEMNKEVIEKNRKILESNIQINVPK